MIGRAEEVGIVLGDPAHAQQAVERSRELGAIDGAQLGQASQPIARPETHEARDHVWWSLASSVSKRRLLGQARR
jgi:hypothetical protein